MAEHNIVAVYDTSANAEAAISALQDAGVPAGSISRHAKQGAVAAEPAQEQGFWASLFGGGSENSTVYDRSVEGGSTAVTVRVGDEHLTRVSDILEAHDPVDLDERAAGFETTTTTTTHAAAAPATTPAMQTGGKQAGDGTISLAAEELNVGKRAVRGGTTRVHTYVVEKPVEEQVTLHSETVHVDRRPVTDGHQADAAAFEEKTIEMQETAEEAVVGKTARIVEEISLRTESSEHVETVKDTVRRDEVEIEDLGSATAATKGVANTSPVPPARKN